MKTNLNKKALKMLWDVSEVMKTQTTQNVISAAKQNDIKITHEDLQKLAVIVNSTIDQVCINASKSFESRLVELVETEADSKSRKTK